MGIILALCCASSWSAPPAAEYQVKAAYLFNFGQFVEWPAAAWIRPNAPFAICIVGDDPFGSVIDDVVRGESLNGHQLVIRRFRPGDDDRGLQHPVHRPQRGRERAAAAGRTAWPQHSDGHGRPGVESREAIIALITENNRVRMRINIAAARANNLVISSKLLRPAEVIGNEART